MSLIEDRRIYFVEGKYWMVLTVAELNLWMAEAPHLVKYVHREACSEVTKRDDHKVEARKMADGEKY